MFYFYNGYHFWGMDLMWWFFWLMIMIWIFAIPFDLPGQRKRKDSPVDILKKRFASGEMTKDEYRERKKILENE